MVIVTLPIQIGITGISEFNDQFKKEDFPHLPFLKRNGLEVQLIDLNKIKIYLSMWEKN